MKRTAISFIKISLLFLFLHNISFAQSNYEQAISQSKKIIEDVMKEKALPGVAVAVSIKGKMVWSEGFGYSDIENKIEVSASESKFRIGSVSKPLTAVGLAVLFQKNPFSLDAPIQKYVPGFPEKKWAISLKQLAGHTAGIRHYRGTEFMSKKKYETVSEGLEIFKNDPLEFEPGTKYSYSSYGWNLVSAGMEGISKEPFLEFMEREVFKKMGLENTIADHADKDIDNRTKFYHLVFGQVTEAPYVDNSYKWAGGGFLSTAEDLLKFGNALLYDKILEENTLELFITPQKTSDGKSTNYGIGFRSGEDKKGRKWYGHSGGSVGGTTMWMIFPEEEIVVTMITNMSQAGWKKAPFSIANQFLMKD